MKLKVKRLSGLAKVRGLTFVDTIEPVYLETRFGIHTFFVRKPIDVLVLNEYFKVVKMKKKLKPWRIFLWNPKYFNVIETPYGFVVKNRIELGNKIDLK